jgi:hypothetical protein
MLVRTLELHTLLRHGLPFLASRLTPIRHEPGGVGESAKSGRLPFPRFVR